MRETYAKALFQSIFSKSKGGLSHQICVKWDYCSKRTQYKNKVMLANAIVGAINFVLKDVPLTVLYAIAFILIKMGLDDFCKCKP